MSNKLAKVLLICALVVVLPLFIAGTVIAVYYSMNAVTTFEVYTDSQIVSAPTITSGATVEYDAETGSYRVINGHSKVTSVEYSAEGFNFNYWFDGSREEYVKLIGDIANASDETVREELNAELEAKTLSTSDILSFRTGDIENITAVFSAITYDVQYSIATTPNGEAVSGNAELIYGQSIADVLGYNLQNTDTHDFVGFIVNGDKNTIYTTATFPVSAEEITISALWKEVPSFQVRYYKNGEIIDGITSTEFNRNTYTTITVVNPMEQNTNGYTAVWQRNGVEFTEVTADMLANPVYDTVNYIDVNLVETPIVYNVKITGNASSTTATYRNDSSFTVTADNYSIFDTVRSVSNWTFGQYAWEFDDFTYNSTEYTTASALINAITTANSDSTNGTINIVVNFRRVATEYTFHFYDGNTYIGQSTSTDTLTVVELPDEACKVGYQITRVLIDGEEHDVLNYSHRYENGQVLVNNGYVVLRNSDIFDGVTTKSIYLTYTAVPLTIEIDDADYRGTETIIEAITIENYETKLAPLFEKDNWVGYSNIQTWSKNVTIGEQNFTDATSLFNYLLGNYKAGDTATITSVVSCVITSLNTNGVTYNGATSYTNGSLPENNPAHQSVTDFSVSIFSEESIFGLDLVENSFYNGDAEVEPTEIMFELNGQKRTFEFSSLGEDTTIYNFLNIIYAENNLSPGKTITLTGLILYFQPISQ